MNIYSQFHNHCKICDLITKPSKNALSLHLRTHYISNESYYLQYIDNRNVCLKCKNLVKFRNIQKGFDELCGKCSHQNQWEGELGKIRREKARIKQLESPMGNGGRPLGSKNDNPYPMSDAKVKHMDKLSKIPHIWNNSSEKVNKCKTTWELKTNEEIAKISYKRTKTSMSKGSRYHQGRFTPTNPSKYDGNPTEIFYRSGWELKFFLWCDRNPSVIKYSVEQVIIPYKCPTDNRMHRYFVDAKIQIKTINGELKTYLIEIKPDKQTRPPEIKKRQTKNYINEVSTWLKNEAKWEAAKKWCADKNMEFLVITEYELGIAQRK